MAGAQERIGRVIRVESPHVRDLQVSAAHLQAMVHRPFDDGLTQAGFASQVEQDLLHVETFLAHRSPLAEADYWGQPYAMTTVHRASGGKLLATRDYDENGGVSYAFTHFVEGYSEVDYSCRQIL